MVDVALIVNGRRYGGWKSVRVTRSLESIAGSFELDVSDRWGGQEEPWPIAEYDTCRVEIGGVPVIGGYIRKRRQSLSRDARALGYSGADRAKLLVDCSAIVSGAAEAKNKWSYRNVDVAAFTAAVAKPFGVPVTVQPGLKLAKEPLLVVHPGDTCFEAIKRATDQAGVIVVSDGAGGIVITRSGTGRASALVQGFNVLSADVEYDGDDRFYRYLISSQVPGTDEASGDATRVQAETTDAGVRMRERVLLIRPDKGYNAADAKRRADWEARVRAARAEKVSISVQGWTQPNSSDLWPINALALVEVPAIGVHGDMLISQVDFTISNEGGQVTQLSLVRPDAFTPEPKAVVRPAEGLWKEIAGGAF